MPNYHSQAPSANSDQLYYGNLVFRPHLPGPFGVDNRTGPRPYPSTCLETLDFEARELLVHRDDRRDGPDRDTLA